VDVIISASGQNDSFLLQTIPRLPPEDDICDPLPIDAAGLEEDAVRVNELEEEIAIDHFGALFLHSNNEPARGDRRERRGGRAGAGGVRAADRGKGRKAMANSLQGNATAIKLLPIKFFDHLIGDQTIDLTLVLNIIEIEDQTGYRMR
jgi:hypothetical protein